MSRGGKPSRRVTCPRCGLVQVDPQPDADELARYYATDYHRDHGPVSLTVSHPDGSSDTYEPGHEYYPEAVRIMHLSRAERVVADLNLPPGSRVLEIGCSDGKTLDYL